MSQNMQQRFRLYRRGWGVYYVEDTQTHKHTSLGTANKQEAQRIVHAKNEAHRQPLVNREIARAYLAAADPDATTRTWQTVMAAMVENKQGKTKVRMERAFKSEDLDHIRRLAVVETRAEHFLRVLKNGAVSTNVYLRRLHNFALDMHWLMGPVIVKRQWPKPQYGEKRAITREEHELILANEPNGERRLLYQVLWFTGGSQSDIAELRAGNIDWNDKVIVFDRLKTKWRKQAPPVIRISEDLATVLRQLPSDGLLFPGLAAVREADRATMFKRRCQRLNIAGITLHSYRYAWAERAKACGYPERYAQQALGHSSKAVHRAYSRKAQFVVPALEDYAKQSQDGKIIQIDLAQAAAQQQSPTMGATDPVAASTQEVAHA